MCSMESLPAVVGTIGALVFGVGGIWISRGQLRVSQAQADISRRQVEINLGQLDATRTKLRHDLFDRRLVAHDRIRAHLSKLIAQQVPSFEEKAQFLMDRNEAHWLFGESVDAFLDGIWDRMADFETTMGELDGLTRGDPDLEQLRVQRQAHNLWFFEQAGRMRAIFDPYLMLGR